MKNSLLLAAVAISTFAFSQKKNETSAAVEYKNKFIPALRSQDFETAKKSIMNAKEFIDLAAAHPDTKDGEKTNYYKGEIYMGMSMIAQMTGDTSIASDKTMQEGLDAYKKSYSIGKKYQGDIEESVYKARVMFDQSANKMYNDGNFKAAAEMYNWQAKFANTVDQLDSNAVFYSAVCAEKAEDYDMAAANYASLAKVGFKGATTYSLASNAFRKAGKADEAKAVVAEGRKLYPSDRDLLLELVNINIDEGNAEGAEAALAAAIATDPNNKQLHYTIGTIYIDLKENEKAEKALEKALSIDPDYIDAQYQLGAHLVSWAGNMKDEANQLKFGDAKYDVMMAQSEELYKKALVPLEKYIATAPNDKAVLTILFQLQRSLGNSEKALEYKKRADAAE